MGQRVQVPAALGNLHCRPSASAIVVGLKALPLTYVRDRLQHGGLATRLRANDCDGWNGQLAVKTQLHQLLRDDT